MSRNEKIAKLTSAIREWRGIWNPNRGVWAQPPKEKAVFKVDRWLKELGRPDPDGDILAIGEFKTTEDMNTWIRNL